MWAPHHDVGIFIQEFDEFFEAPETALQTSKSKNIHAHLLHNIKKKQNVNYINFNCGIKANIYMNLPYSLLPTNYMYVYIQAQRLQLWQGLPNDVRD